MNTTILPLQTLKRLPGWIEQTYLEQLNGAEYRRLKGE